MTAIYRLVQSVSGFVGPNGLLEQIVEIVSDPLVEVTSMFRAIYFGGQFIATRPFATYPHCSYDIGPAVDFLKSFR